MKKIIKAWAIEMNGKLPAEYVFSYDGEKTLMVFPTKKDAQVFRGVDKLADIYKIELVLPPQKSKKK